MLFQFLTIGEGEVVKLILLEFFPLLIRFVSLILLLVRIVPHELFSLLEQEVILSLPIIGHLLFEVLNEIGFGVFQESEVPLGPCKLVIGLSQPFVTDLFL